MSLVCLMMGLRVPLFPPPHLTIYDIESFTKGFGSRGGGIFFIIIMTGCAARILKTPTPIHIKAKPENDTYSYIFSKREPHGFCICTYDILLLYPGPNSCAVFVCQLQFKPSYTPLLYRKIGEYMVTHHPPPLLQP